LENYSESSSSVAERDALRKIVLLRWSVGAVGGDITCVVLRGNLLPILENGEFKKRPLGLSRFSFSHWFVASGKSKSCTHRRP
jgi:hypothetical protein